MSRGDRKVSKPGRIGRWATVRSAEQGFLGESSERQPIHPELLVETWIEAAGDRPGIDAGVVVDDVVAQVPAGSRVNRGGEIAVRSL
jgi:hypothetical protein